MGTKFLNGYSAADVMAIGTARELPETEARYREIQSAVYELEERIRNWNGELPGELELLSDECQKKTREMERVRQQYDFCISCAEYVTTKLKVQL